MSKGKKYGLGAPAVQGQARAPAPQISLLVAKEISKPLNFHRLAQGRDGDLPVPQFTLQVVG